VTSVYNWNRGITYAGRMQPLQWQPRQWTSVNKVITTLSDRKLYDLLYNVVSRLLVRGMVSNVNARYGLIMPLLKSITCDCFTRASNCFTGLTSPDATCSTVPSSTTTCSGAQGTVTTTPSNFPQNSTGGSLDTTVAMAGGAVAGGSGPSPVTASHFSTMSKYKLMAVGNSATYAIIKNTLGAVVGQLVGNGYTVSSYVALVYPIQVCIQQSSSIVG